MKKARIKAEKDRIDKLEYWELAYLWRNCDASHPYFDHKLPLYGHLEARFMGFGGMTKEMSRNIGWKREADLTVDKIVRDGNEK